MLGHSVLHVKNLSSSLQRTPTNSLWVWNLCGRDQDPETAKASFSEFLLLDPSVMQDAREAFLTANFSNEQNLMAIRHCISKSWNACWNSYASGHHGPLLTPTFMAGSIGWQQGITGWGTPFGGCSSRLRPQASKEAPECRDGLLSGRRLDSTGGPSACTDPGLQREVGARAHAAPSQGFPLGDSTPSGGTDMNVIAGGSRNGLNLGALTAPGSQSSFPAALLLGGHLILIPGCGRALVLGCSPRFSGAFFFGVLPGSAVPLDRALSGLTGLSDRLLGGARTTLPWKTRGALSPLRPPAFTNPSSPRTLPGSRTGQCGLRRGPVTRERPPAWMLTLWSWVIIAEGCFVFLR